MKKIKGFTLIELLIVVAIIGIIAAIAIPNLLSAIQRGKQKRAMGEIRSIATSAQAYSTDAERFPNSATAYVAITGADTVSTMLAPDYMQKMPSTDSWKHTYWYASDGTEFTVQAYGKGSTYDGAPTVAGTGNSTNCFENDIVWNNDNFVIKPEGKQKKCL